ncbi:MAG: alpha/beta fold hydrolase [Frankia sp.]
MRDRELVLLHGQPGSRADWLGVLEHLPGEIRAVAVDRPGYGVSGEPAGDLEDNARAVLAGMDARGTERAVLVGHSFGGGVALATAALAPERVEALVLVASVGPECLTPVDYLLAAPVAGEIAAVVAFAVTAPFARARLNRSERRAARPVPPDEHVSLQIWGRTQADHGHVWRSFLVEQRALVADLPTLVSRLPAVTAPALIIADPDDAVVPMRTPYALRAALTDSELIEVSGTGHHIPRVHAAGLVAHMTRFLTALDERPADQASA